MRSVVFGAGAVGGVVGARLHQAGRDVALIATGAHLKELRHSGLTLETPSERTVLRIPAAAEQAELGVGASGSEDVVQLATKSQDTAGALDGLRGAGALEVPIVSLQNGVARCAADERREELAVRDLGAIETEYLDGEIVLAGRLHGVPVPINATLCRLASEQARGHAAPGELSVDDVLAAVGT